MNRKIIISNNFLFFYKFLLPSTLLLPLVLPLFQRRCCWTQTSWQVGLDAARQWLLISVSHVHVCCVTENVFVMFKQIVPRMIEKDGVTISYGVGGRWKLFLLNALEWFATSLTTPPMLSEMPRTQFLTLGKLLVTKFHVLLPW